VVDRVVELVVVVVVIAIPGVVLFVVAVAFETFAETVDSADVGLTVALGGIVGAAVESVDADITLAADSEGVTGTEVVVTLTGLTVVPETDGPDVEALMDTSGPETDVVGAVTLSAVECRAVSVRVTVTDGDGDSEVIVDSGVATAEELGIRLIVALGGIVGASVGEKMLGVAVEITLVAGAEVKLVASEDVTRGPTVDVTLTGLTVITETGVPDVEESGTWSETVRCITVAAVEGAAVSVRATLTEDGEDKEDIVDSEVDAVVTSTPDTELDADDTELTVEMKDIGVEYVVFVSTTVGDIVTFGRNDVDSEVETSGADVGFTLTTVGLPRDVILAGDGVDDGKVTADEDVGGAETVEVTSV